MAIYFSKTNMVSRGKGQSVVSRASYICGEKMKDERLGKTYNNASKEVHASEILAPEDSPKWVYDSEKLWNIVEKKEKRKDSQLARQFIFALPKELNYKDQKYLVNHYVKKNFIERGMIANVAYHGINKSNPHVHILLTTRKLEGDKFGKKIREWNKKELLQEWRKSWADTTNRLLQHRGHKSRIDQRSYKEQGIDKLAQKHMGNNAIHLEKQGIKTEKGDYNRAVKEYNDAVKELKELKTEKKKFVKDSKAELSSLIDEVLQKSRTKKEFIFEMEKRGYQVIWKENNKYMTYITPQGAKYRDRRLQEKHSKRSLEKHFSEKVFIAKESPIKKNKLQEKKETRAKVFDNEIRSLEIEAIEKASKIESLRNIESDIEHEIKSLSRGVKKYLNKDRIEELKTEWHRVGNEIVKESYQLENLEATIERKKDSKRNVKSITLEDRLKQSEKTKKELNKNRGISKKRYRDLGRGR